jgi:hypothetical protein
LDVAKDLFDNFWSKMVTQNQYYTGASWEYLFPDGSPGIGLFTSLSHPWGSSPTYLLSQYVLGISAVQPGYEQWQFKPMVYGLGLNDAEGTVPTPFGPIYASWSFQSGRLVLVVEAPKGTVGTIALPFAPSSCNISGQNSKQEGQNVTITGGNRVQVVAAL